MASNQVRINIEALQRIPPAKAKALTLSFMALSSFLVSL
jgi:hypothetical protein